MDKIIPFDPKQRAKMKDLKQENELRKKSIRRLLKQAEKLRW